MAKSLHTPQYEYFRSLLVASREKMGLTQTEVSSILKRPQSFVAKYEGGERRLDIIEFIEICAALGVDPHSLLANVKDMMDK